MHLLLSRVIKARAATMPVLVKNIAQLRYHKEAFSNGNTCLREEIFLQHESSFGSKHVTTPMVTQGTNRYQLFKDMDIIFPMTALTFLEFGYYSLSKLSTFKPL